MAADGILAARARLPKTRNGKKHLKEHMRTCKAEYPAGAPWPV